MSSQRCALQKMYINYPRVESDLFIFVASFRRSPSAPELFCLHYGIVFKHTIWPLKYFWNIKIFKLYLPLRSSQINKIETSKPMMCNTLRDPLYTKNLVRPKKSINDNNKSLRFYHHNNAEKNHSLCFQLCM